MSTYSFQSVLASIIGPGGSFPLSVGAGAAEEGITIDAVDDQNTMTIGAGGAGMHSLSASHARTVTVRLLKTSPVNAGLQLMYNLQTAAAILHGHNVITVGDVARGDSIVLTSVAFKKQPTVNYAKDGGIMEWTFDAIGSVTMLGIGLPEII